MSLSKRTKSILIVAMADKRAATEVSAAVDFGSANTGVTPGSYTSANITIDAQGRISAASNGSGGGGLPSMSGHAKQFLTNNGSVASWDTHLTTDITAGGAGGGGSTGLVIIGGDQVAPNTKATKLILNNVDGGSNWSLVNFDSTHGPGQGYFALTCEGNGQALYADPDNLEVTMPSGAYLGNILSSTSGQLKFFNTNTSPTSGYVWTCTATDGRGDWQPSGGGGSSLLDNDVYLKGKNAGLGPDIDIVKVNTSNAIELGHPNSSQGIQIQTDMIDIWGSHNPGSGEVWIHSHLTRLYNPPSSASSPLLLFGNTDGTFGVSVKAANGLAADMTLTLPDNTGTAGQVLSTDGSGLMSWTSMFNPGAIPSDLVFDTGIVGVLKTKDNPGGNTTNLTISTGLPSAGVSQSGDLNLFTALSTTPGSSSGAINMISGDAGNSGIITIRTGNASTASGDLNLITGTAGGTHGHIVFQDGTEGTPGHIWTSTNASGAGAWVASSGANQTLSNLTSPTAINQDLIFDTGATATLKTKDDSAITRGLNITTGASSGDETGPISIFPGASSAASNGSLSLFTPDTLAADLISGNVSLATGGASGTGVSGNITVGTGPTADGNSGILVLVTGSTGNGNTGSTTLGTGTPTGNGNSGSVEIYSGGLGSVPGNSGNINITSGNLDSTGTSGNVSISTGTTGGGTRGKIQLKNGSEGTAGQVWTSTDTLGSGAWVASSAPSNAIRAVVGNDTISATTDHLILCDTTSVGSFNLQLPPGTDGLEFIFAAKGGPGVGDYTVVVDGGGDAFDTNTTDPTVSNTGGGNGTPLRIKFYQGFWYSF